MVSLTTPFVTQLAKAGLLVLDDFGHMPFSEQTKRDLLEILDDRYDRRATLVTSQLRPASAETLDRLHRNQHRAPLST